MFTYIDKPIYYEVHGAGEPLLVLNGIFMSSASWAAFVPSLSKHNRVILLDFVDQGKSGKMHGVYTQDLHVETIRALLEHLNIHTANILGISYGAEVAMLLAAKYPQLVGKLILANTTAYTNPWLQDMGRAWEYAISANDGRQFFKTCIPVVYSPRFYTHNIAWARQREELFTQMFTNEVYAAFLRLIHSAEDFDVRESLADIKAPTLVVSSEFDYITPLQEQELIVRKIPHAAHLLIKDAGHASMYEKPVEFTSAVLGFLSTDADLKVI